MQSSYDCVDYASKNLRQDKKFIKEVLDSIRITYKKAKLEDAKELELNANDVYKKYADTFKHIIHKPDIFADNERDDLVKVLKMLIQDESNHIFTIYYNDLIIGYFMYNINLIDNKNVLILKELNILKQYRNIGIETKTINTLIEYSKRSKIDKVWVNTWCLTPNAKKLYKELNFKEKNNVMEFNLK